MNNSSFKTKWVFSSEHFRKAKALAVLVLATAFLSGVRAQYELNWSTIDGGGGNSTGGVYSVTATIGQPDAGTMSGGIYSMRGGFWSVIATVQTEEAPYLTVMRSNNTVVVSWPLPADGWVLEWTNALPQVSASWPQLLPPYQTNGPNLQFNEPVPTGNRFYRLHRP